MGKRKKKEEQVEEEQALSVVDVPGDLLPEILSRVPYQSLCRFKCVSRAWLALCSDPAVRKRSPQTLSGFFCLSPGRPLSVEGIRFLNLSGRGQPMVDPSLRFLRGYEYVVIEDCCAGILLCSCFDRAIDRWVYVVCNPATQEIWAALLVPRARLAQKKYCITCLGFNPAVPGRFAVFELIQGQGNIEEVDVYSSDTREWTSMASGWGPGINMLYAERRHIILDGTLHLIAHYCEGDATDSIINLIVTVDMDGSTWRTIQMPPKVCFDFIGQSQGHLYGMEVDRNFRISVWVLEDYASGQWTLKAHTASVSELLGRPCREKNREFYFYRSVAIHPDRNLLFIASGVKRKKTFMSYGMDNKKLHCICTLEEYDAGTFQPYIPCFVEQPSVAQ